MCKSHNLVENVCPSRGFHFRAEKQTQCHLNSGATQTSPLQNQSAKGAEYEAGSTTRPGTSSKREKKKIKTESAARVPRPPWARRRALGPSGQSRRRREARRRARLPPEPGDSRPTLASALSPSLAPAAPRTRLLALQRGPNAPRGAEGDRQGLGQPGRYRRGGS